ncbi:STAS/SEC14 domain-containing protein [Thioclava sp.]|uniref:STAS/SEC14 domain-containing protein n=1 Tax=Thioclava sp. TaxID=1933450 RepID=UPI003AA8C688
MLNMKQDGNVFVLTMKGKVTADEVTAFYDKFTPAIEKADRVGIVIDISGFDDMTVDAIRHDIPLEIGMLDQMGKIPRAAVVSDKAFIGALVKAVNPLIPMIDMRIFGPDEMDAALKFASDLPDRKPKGKGAHVIESSDKNVFAFEIDGYVADDEMHAISAEINARIERGETFNALARIKSFGGLDPKILTDGSFFKMKLGSIEALKKYALVSDEQWLKPLIGFANKITGIEMRHFPLADEAAARAWLSA